MSKYIEEIIVFVTGIVSGFILCGVAIGKMISKSEHLKNDISEAVSHKVEKILYGKESQQDCYRGSYVSYVNYRKNTFSVDKVIFETRNVAESILTSMKEIIKKYGVVSVTDYYDLADISANFKASVYGWVNLERVKVYRVADGYIIDLPEPIHL